MSTLADRLATRIAAARPGTAGPLLVGLCGAQGSGKSTLAEQARERLEAAGLRTAIMSIDDIYRTRGERAALAARIHPLLATRGVPGTHDVALGAAVIDALGADGQVRLPRFDKGADDRLAQSDWPLFAGPADVILLEGWCIGAVPEPDEALAAPVNRLEAEEDGDGRWRRYVNAALAGDYQRLFARIDLLAMLAAPSFEVVLGWRTEQERKLREAGGGARVMSDAALARFIAHYERLTRWMLREMPARADVLVRLGPERQVLEARGL